MGVSNEAKNVIPLKFLRKIENTIFFPLVNSIRERTVYYATLQTLTHTYSSMLYTYIHSLCIVYTG
jgi:hypothetical protein